MGYHAPDADEIYDYIFRRGRHAPNKLSDGFGWSILFVNDGSRVCKKLLARYGAELCYRTADRVRFVFFSGLTKEETTSLASKANSEWGSQRRIGFLPRILNAVGQIVHPRRRFDLERDEWNELRPETFHPLDSRERIDRHLDMECEINSAMPGAEEALRLAQRIGIGRFVPCFLLFSDVGNPVVYLLPIADKSPAEVFERLRVWIDSFYEINNGALKHWADVEKAIEASRDEFRSTVNSLSGWRQERSEAWGRLRCLSFYQRRLEGTALTLALIEEIEADRGLSWDLQGVVRTFREQWQATEQTQRHAHEVKQWSEKLSKMDNAQAIHAELMHFKEREGRKVPKPLLEAITLAVRLFKVPPPPSTPQERVLDWWRSEHGRSLSRNKYDKLRSAWVTYSREKHGKSAIGRASEIRKDEFTVVSEAACAQLLDCKPEIAAENVVEALAYHLEVTPQSAEWQQALASYRRTLIAYFTGLQTSAPAWLFDASRRSTAPLTWGDCIPAVDLIRNIRRKHWLPLLPRLHAIVEQASIEWDATTGAEERRLRELRRDCIAGISSAADDWVSASGLLEADKLSIGLALVSNLSAIRQELENKVFSQSKELKTAAFPGPVSSRDSAARLLQLLDDYDIAVQSLSMPFVKDREVVRVSLDVPLRFVQGMRQNHATVSPVEMAKSGLTRAVTEAEAAINSWSSTKREALEWSPQGRLCIALKETLAPSRLAECQPAFGTDNPLDAIAALASRREITRLLDQLALQELLALENRIYEEASLSALPKAVTKEQIYESILVGIGLGWDSQAKDGSSLGANRATANDLREKARRGEFDVFLAHNSEDQAIVMRLGRRLRDHGVYPWIDAEQVPPGRWFQDVLQSAVRTVKAAAIVIGVSGVGKWQAVELRAFISRCVESSIPIIPVLLPGRSVIPEGLIFLQELNQVKFVNDITENEGIARLIWGITGEKTTNHP